MRAVRRLKGILQVMLRACGLDGRRVQDAVASFLGKADAVAVNIFKVVVKRE